MGANEKIVCRNAAESPRWRVKRMAIIYSKSSTEGPNPFELSYQ